MPRSYEGYCASVRELIGPSIQFPGLSPEEFQAACEDPLTVFVETSHGAQPLLSRIVHMNWVNQESVEAHLGGAGWFLSPLTVSRSQSRVPDCEKVTRVLCPLVNGTRDHVDVATALLARHGEVTEKPLLDGAGRELEDSQFMVDVYPVIAPALTKWRDADIGVEVSLSLADAAWAWEFYDIAFKELGRWDVLAGGFPKEEFVELMLDPSAPKAIARVKGRPVCLTFGTLELEACDWLDADYVRQQGPFDQVLVNLGVVTNPDQRGVTYSGAVFRALARWAADHAGHYRLLFECNQVSRAYTPRLVARALADSGQPLDGSLSEPISATRYTALLIGRRP